MICACPFFDPDTQNTRVTTTQSSQMEQDIMRSPSPWSILVHPPGRASESPERPASATITHDGWPGGFETDRPHADRPMRADPQPADRSVRPAFVGVPKIAHIIRADRPDGSRIPFDPDLCIEHPLPGDEHRRRLLYRCPAEARPGDRDGDGDLWIYRELLWGMSVRNNRPYRPQETSGDCRFVTRGSPRDVPGRREGDPSRAGR